MVFNEQNGENREKWFVSFKSIRNSLKERLPHLSKHVQATDTWFCLVEERSNAAVVFAHQGLNLLTRITFWLRSLTANALYQMEE